MVPSPHAQPQQRGWKGCCQRNRGAGSNAAAPLLRSDPHARGSYSSPACRPLAALPTGNAPGGGSSPRGLGVLDRTPTASSTAAPGVDASPGSTSAAVPPAAAALPDRTVGYLSLSLVPILWGTYNPCIRYLYAEADPLDPASLTAVRTLLSAGALLLPALVGYLVREGRETWRRNQANRLDSGIGAAASAAADPPHHETLGATLAATSDGAADGVAAAAAADEAAGGVGGDGSGAARRSLFAQPLNGVRLGPILTRTFDSVVLGGLELGLLNFLGTALQVEGLHSTSATRAGFLAEVTAVLTPFVSYLAGYDIPRQMWLAVAVGLVGSTMVAYDTSQAHDDSTPTAASPAPAPSAAAPAAAVPLPSVTETRVPAAATAASTAAALDAGPSADVRPEGGTSAATLDGSSMAAATATSPGAGLGRDLDGVVMTAADGAAGAGAGVATATSPHGVSAAVTSQLADDSAGASALEAVPEAAAAVSVSPAAGDVAIRTSATAFAADPAAAALAAVAVPVADAGTATVTADAGAAVFQNAAPEAATSASAAIGDAAAAADAAASAATNIVSALSAAVDAAAAAGLPAVAATAAAASSGLEAVGPSAAGAASGAVAVAATEAAAAAAAASAATPLAITGGEGYLLLACLFYSICTVRMGIYAPRMDTVSLAAMKKVGLSSMSVLWMAATNLQHGAAPGSMLSFPDLSSRTPISIAVLMYSGLGPGALATFLQVTGLSTVPATTAQVIYSMTPLITAFFAYLILGGEATGPVAWAGGSLIIVAALMAADAQQKQQREQQQQHLEQQKLQQQ